MVYYEDVEELYTQKAKCASMGGRVPGFTFPQFCSQVANSGALGGPETMGHYVECVRRWTVDDLESRTSRYIECFLRMLEIELRQRGEEYEFCLALPEAEWKVACAGSEGM